MFSILIVVATLTVAVLAGAETFDVAQFAPPSGWKVSRGTDHVTYTHIDEAARTYCLLGLYASAASRGGGERDFTSEWEAVVRNAFTTGPAPKPWPGRTRGGLSYLAGDARTSQGNVASYVRLYVFPVGSQVVSVLVSATDAAALSAREAVLSAFLDSLRLQGATASAAAPGVRTPLSQGTPSLLSPAGLIDGKPQGLFVGVSILSGNPAGLLFLDGGRVYHGIPPELDHIEWQQLQADHADLIGRWTMQGTTLRINWPDGNIWESPLEPTATGFKFNGKSYGAVHPATMDHLAGSWEGTQSTAWLNVGDGPAMTQINSLHVAADGSYTWGAVTGGDVGNAVAYGEAAFAGKVEIDGYEAIFHARDGKTMRVSLARWSDSDVLILGGAFYFRK